MMKFDYASALERYEQWFKQKEFTFHHNRVAALKAIELLTDVDSFTVTEFAKRWKSLGERASIPASYKVLIELSQCGVILIEERGVAALDGALPSKTWRFKIVSEANDRREKQEQEQELE